LIELAKLRRENNDITYLRPDAKSQVTIEYSDDNVPERIDAIVISTQHDDFDESDEVMLAKIKKDMKKYGIRNSLLIAPMPTASTAQIMGNTECIDPI